MSASSIETDAAQPLLDVQGINVYYGEFHALQDVSYRINEGEIVSLLGGNASGKSTTMKAILRLVKTRSGEIRFAGRVIPPQTSFEPGSRASRRPVASSPR